MMDRHPRLVREEKTVAAMIDIYCRAHHGTRGELCDDCNEMLDYARLRLSACPYQEDKPTCANCPIHCYALEMRERIRATMRYAGPRMLLRYPILAIRHVLDGRRKAPDLRRRTGEK